MFHFQEIVSECFSYNNKVWTQIQSLTVPRYGAAFPSVPQLMATSKNDIMVIGGENAAPGLLTSGEIYTVSGDFFLGKFLKRHQKIPLVQFKYVSGVLLKSDDNIVLKYIFLNILLLKILITPKNIKHLQWKTC